MRCDIIRMIFNAAHTLDEFIYNWIELILFIGDNLGIYIACEYSDHMTLLASANLTIVRRTNSPICQTVSVASTRATRKCLTSVIRLNVGQ